MGGSCQGVDNQLKHSKVCIVWEKVKKVLITLVFVILAIYYQISRITIK